MSELKIIGVSGTNGSGKDTVGKMLTERHNFLSVSVSNFLREEAKRRKLPMEREVLRQISAEWRRKDGLGVLVDKAVELFKQSEGKYEGLEVGAIRNPGEADRIHELGGIIVWVDGNPRVRYARIEARARGSEDRKTFEQFLSEEQAEIQHSGDEATLNLAGVKAKANIFMNNDGSNINAFKDAAEKSLASILRTV